MTDKKINPETSRDLRKKSKRIQESRDTLKEKNKEKSVDLKKLRGALDDMKVSRNSWKAQYEQAVADNIKLTTDIKSQSNLLTESKRVISEKDKQLQEIQKKCEEFKKKMK
jgi:chromosome segregation ATPase